MQTPKFKINTMKLKFEETDTAVGRNEHNSWMTAPNQLLKFVVLRSSRLRAFAMLLLLAAGD
jgi:hypothetical protein